MTKDKIHNLNVKNFGNNVVDMLLHRKTLLDDLRVQGEVFNEDLYWAFKCLEMVEQPESFKRYIDDKKSDWEDGGAITALKFCKAAQTKFKHLLEAGKRRFTTNTSNAASSSSNDDARFIALVATVKEPIKKRVNGKSFCGAMVLTAKIICSVITNRLSASSRN